MLAEISQRTPFDLNFSLFRIRVRVQPFHWLTSAILGWDIVNGSAGLPGLLVWILCVFVSVLLHEVGHVLMGRLFGSDGNILLYSFGGLAIGSAEVRKRWQRVLVYAAGPGIQFLFFSLLWLAWRAVDQGRNIPPLVRHAYDCLWWINLVWAIFNLLPIWPLDGGQISREVFEGLMPRSGTTVALLLSAFLSGLLAVEIFLVAQGGVGLGLLRWLPLVFSPITAIFLLLFCVNSLQELQAVRRRRHGYDDRFPWE